MDDREDAPAPTIDDLFLLDAVIQAYCGRHSTGGSLHVVLDDGNWDRGSIAHCRDFAREQGDPLGEAIAVLLLQAPDEVIAVCGDGDWPLGFSMWLGMARRG